MTTNKGTPSMGGGGRGEGSGCQTEWPNEGKGNCSAEFAQTSPTNLTRAPVS